MGHWTKSISGPVSEPMDIELLAVKGDHDNPALTRLSTHAAPAPKNKKTAALKGEAIPPPEAPKDPRSLQDQNVGVGSTDSTLDAQTQPGAEAGGRFGSADGAEASAEKRYTAELRALLERRKEYPILARRLRQQGKVIVKFTLKRNGEVLRTEVVENSEFDSLNRAAEKLITSMNGLKPFPDEVKKSEWIFVLPVEYRM